MSSDIRIKLTNSTPSCLPTSPNAKGSAEAVVLEALHELFSERLQKSFLISKGASSRPVLAILSEPARKAAAAD